MDWQIFRDKGYLELTGQGKGSHNGLDISHHVPPELDTQINCYNVSTINTTYHPPSVNVYHPPSMDISYPPASLFDPSSIFAPHEIKQLTENPHHLELVISTHSTQSWMPCDRVFSVHIVMAGDRPNWQGEVARVQNSTQLTKHVCLPILPTGDPPAANALALVPVNLQPTATMHIPDYVVKHFKDKAKKELHRYFMME
ncbi:hypothetical protein F5J12DRAFT_785545 [Pisolithus orientalis]|uniref:uncharacterized protein n=1 Tax=Pisolithus orientalis TaxID=936130 RepID=UPI00222486C6|nr:uncharacterized protein F5J12DRAFT_785545 [Pisolithus orientalis]KAI5995770.1 hypothetical protein F5J12DRAFT_785545 [Pisolithus orientalis]